MEARKVIIAKTATTKPRICGIYGFLSRHRRRDSEHDYNAIWCGGDAAHNQQTQDGKNDENGYGD
jgi:hypothetical protein